MSTSTFYRRKLVLSVLFDGDFTRIIITLHYKQQQFLKGFIKKKRLTQSKLIDKIEIYYYLSPQQFTLSFIFTIIKNVQVFLIKLYQ